jgi:hypothetical protein
VISLEFRNLQQKGVVALDIFESVVGIPVFAEFSGTTVRDAFMSM